MAKITINCGQCGVKKCGIKQDFRSLAEKYPKGVIKSEFSQNEYSYDKTFSLKCTYKEYKYNNGDKVLISLGIGRYKEKHVHECLMEDQNCNSCNFEHKCIDEEVTHINTKYKEYITIEAIIGGYYKSDKYVYTFDIRQLESKMNEMDNKLINSINSNLNPGFNEWISIDKNTFYGISKSKFINLI